MKTVLSDRILEVPWDAAYLFKIPDGFSPVNDLKIIDLRNLSESEELSGVQRALSDASSPNSARLHVLGVSLAESVAAIRTEFQTLGYFQDRLNRYELPFETAKITFSCELADTGFADVPARHGTFAAKSVRSALNSGVLSGLRLELHSPGKWKIRTEPELVARMLSEGACSPFVLWKICYYHFARIGLVSQYREIRVTIPSCS